MPGVVPGMHSAQLHDRARRRGVNPFVYWLTRAILQPFFHLYVLRRAQVRAPAVDALAGLIAGDVAPERWCESLVAPRRVA